MALISVPLGTRGGVHVQPPRGLTRELAEARRKSGKRGPRLIPLTPRNRLGWALLIMSE